MIMSGLKSCTFVIENESKLSFIVSCVSETRGLQVKQVIYRSESREEERKKE